MRRQDFFGSHPSRGNLVRPGPINAKWKRTCQDPVAAKRAREIQLIDERAIEDATPREPWDVPVS